MTKNRTILKSQPKTSRHDIDLTVECWANDTANMSYTDRLDALIQIIENERMSDDVAAYFGGLN